ncbi:LysR family transcriptional regulator [Pelagibius sp. Alg239-R121]|uniref:LysR family transcriptional regulator n=1 Tax=Pelagibius sp. Alg239-R121 TaxID=2993448 RepID=UPI0034617043
MINWDDAKVVLAVARGGTFAAAARTLGLDETTIARRLTRMERALGLEVFQAHDGRRIPTSRGATLIAQAERLEVEALRLEHLAGENTEEAIGCVRIAATDMMTRHILAPQIGKLLKAHPKVTLRFLTGHENVSFARWETDLAVRLARPERGDLVVRKLADLRFAVFESPDNKSPGNRKPEVKKATTRKWLAYHDDLAHLPEARFVAGKLDGAEPVLRSNDLDALTAAVETGAGAACLPMFVAQTTQRGKLGRLSVVPDEKDLNLVREAWLLMRPDQREVHSVRAVADWIVESFREAQPRLLGQT